jgi:hypothetical protein
MIDRNEIELAQRIAALAAAAREARDRMLTKVRDSELSELSPVRSAHNSDPEDVLGFAVLPDDEPALKRLREGIGLLPAQMRRTLWAVMQIGTGDYASGDWDAVRQEADNLSDQRISIDLADDPDLHDKMMKGLYELGVADTASRPG